MEKTHLVPEKLKTGEEGGKEGRKEGRKGGREGWRKGGRVEMGEEGRKEEGRGGEMNELTKTLLLDIIWQDLNYK